MQNYRYIDDIHTLTGCIPSEKDYGMEYKNTTEREGQLVFLGMRESWVPYSKGTKFVTGMHFRDASYPIVIRRYPAGGSMVTDSQRIGVITGQFIRAQRLCSKLENMKEAVRSVALAAFRRGTSAENWTYSGASSWSKGGRLKKSGGGSCALDSKK